MRSERQAGAPQSIRGIDATVWEQARLYGVAHGVSVGEVVTEALAAYLRPVSVHVPERREKEGARPSPKVQRRVREAAIAKFAGDPAPDVPPPVKERVKLEDHKPCSHGLLFHPGCSDAR